MSELADTTVWVLRRRPEVAPWWGRLMLLGEIFICDQAKLELLHSARSGTEFNELRQQLDALENCPIGPAEWLRAIDVYQQLAHRRPGAYHRSVKHADLLIAAAAEAREMTLVHYDRDYDAIQAITNQRMRWIVRHGALG